MARKLARHHVQEPPFAVQVELTEGCNLRCAFCGLSGIRRPKENDFKYMTADTLRSLMSQITQSAWNPRMEFAMHGEPTMHPDLVEMMRIARELAPRLQLMITSNGGGLLRSPGPVATIRALFEAGLNVLALDDYDGVKIVPKIREAWRGRTGVDGSAVVTYEYPRQEQGSPHSRRPLSQRTLIFVEDISKATEGTHSMLNNHAGAGAPKDYSMRTAKCAKPFRELSVRWDGSVAVCCNDWRGEYKCGNIVSEGLIGVWNGERMDAARRKLYHGQRDFGPCDGCNAVSYRVGFLPDKKGLLKLPLPDAETDRIIAEALAGDPYTKPVRREWESKGE